MDVTAIETLSHLFMRNPMAAMTAVVLLSAGVAMGAGWGFLKIRVKHNDNRDSLRDRNILSLTQVGFETLGKVTEVVRACEVSMMRQVDSNNSVNQSNAAISVGLQQVVTALESLVAGQRSQTEQMKLVDRRLGRLEVEIVPRRARRAA